MQRRTHYAHTPSRSTVCCEDGECVWWSRKVCEAYKGRKSNGHCECVRASQAANRKFSLINIEWPNDHFHTHTHTVYVARSTNDEPAFHWLFLWILLSVLIIRYCYWWWSYRSYTPESGAHENVASFSLWAALRTIQFSTFSGNTLCVFSNSFSIVYFDR